MDLEMTLLKLYAKKNQDCQIAGATDSYCRIVSDLQDQQATKMPMERRMHQKDVAPGCDRLSLSQREKWNCLLQQHGCTWLWSYLVKALSPRMINNLWCHLDRPWKMVTNGSIDQRNRSPGPGEKTHHHHQQKLTVTEGKSWREGWMRSLGLRIPTSTYKVVTRTNCPASKTLINLFERPVWKKKPEMQYI